METTEWAKLQEQLLSAQLGVIRSYIKNVAPSDGERRAALGKSKSQISMIRDILMSTSTPLHVSELIRLVQDRYDVVLDRESVVSALTKKVRKGEIFVRTGPNTYGLKDR
jgi:hypothetical protein